MHKEYKEAVKEKTRTRPRLIPLFTSNHDIPEQVYAYNPQLFVCFNRVTDRFEIHSLEQAESFCAVLPYKELDTRTLRWIWKNDIRVHGATLFDLIDKNNERVEKQKKREFHNWVEDVGKETASMFAETANEIGL